MVNHPRVVVSTLVLRTRNGFFAGVNLLWLMAYDLGDITVEMPGGTMVRVKKKEI